MVGNMDVRKGKRTFIVLPSSSEEEEKFDEVESENDDYEIDDEIEDNAFDVIDDDDYRKSVSISSDDEEDESDDDDDREESGNEDEDVDSDDDECLCNRVIRLLKEGNGLLALTLKECKAYLRNHGLRITGTKAVCVHRIKEHWRIKDGHGEALYPRSSFIINCTGDVCKGDFVLFTQRVYEKFDKVTRSGRLLGKRTVAGKVVKESYGAAKQQHTFTVEVLWTKGVRKLPPLSPLLVKGRNLYKMKTFRQWWNNEAERIKVLDEKHKRGQSARLLRSMKKTSKTCFKNGGAKRQKHVHHTESSQRSQTAEVVRGEVVDGRRKSLSQGHASLNNQPDKVPPIGQGKLKQIKRSRDSKYSQSNHKSTKYKKVGGTKLQSHYDPPHNLHYSQMEFFNGNATVGGTKLQSRYDPPHNLHYSQMEFFNGNALPNNEMSSSSTMMKFPSYQSQFQNHFQSQVDFHNRNASFRFPNYGMRSPPFSFYGDSPMLHASQHQGFNNRNYPRDANLYSSYEFNSGINGFPKQMNNDRHLYQPHGGTEPYKERINGFGAY